MHGTSTQWGQGSNTLIWIDLEMTGLNSETDRVIEVATIVTDSQLNVLAEGPILAVHQSGRDPERHGMTGTSAPTPPRV